MSLEAMDAIALAEEKARRIKTAAVQNAKNAVQNAQETGKIVVAAADAKAEEEIHDLVKKADEKAKEDAAILASNTRNRKAAMKARADRKMDEAVNRVMERIVNG